MMHTHQNLSKLVISLYKKGWRTREIAAYVYGDPKATNKVRAIISKARKRGLLEEHDDGSVARDAWRPEAYPRAPFEMAGSSGPLSLGFMSPEEKKRFNVSQLVGELAGITGLKEYPTLYSIAQDVCQYVVRKYPGVNESVAVGCVAIGFLSASPSALDDVIDTLLDALKALLSNSLGG